MKFSWGNKMKKLLILLICGLMSGLMAAPKVKFVENLKAGKEQSIVIFGTSLTKVGAWGGQLATILDQQFPGKAKVINGAQGGANSAWGVKSLDQKVLKHKPDTVFIEFAINDAVERRKTSVEDAKNNLNNLIERIFAQNPECEIILATMNVPVGHTGVQRPKIDDYYQMYRDEAKRNGFKLIDHNAVWKDLLEKDPALYIQYMPDAIHPVYEGALKVITPHLVKELGLKVGDASMSELAPCWKYMFNSMDKIKKDRKVSRDEYELFWANHFKMQDANKDGIIQPKEYPEQGIFNHFDINGDKLVSLDEYQKVYSYHFEKFDKDKSGILDLKKLQYNY
ncbi:putative acyl-CoA thioesterase/lipase protein [Lentisphaera araneosa HTCC2155]|jgi:acyl-CoA thioesterase I|uniref:Putative acyl-CoA thioesterase/lipase protein n=2 Tax=Lentisphaera TaxID=256846 RepID=A6DG36_9BACT|nr:putative acyl-CoA thioesterase/lipase protein [Lentisphaera araneosa HTCC2155]